MGGWCSLNLSHANFLFLECNEKIETKYIRIPAEEEVKFFKFWINVDDVKSASKCRETCLSTPGCNVLSYWENVSSYVSYRCNLFQIKSNAKDFLALGINDSARGNENFKDLVTYFCSGP